MPPTAKVQERRITMPMKEILENPPKIDNYNQAVEMITERGARPQMLLRTGQETGKHHNGEDVNKKLDFL